jgi:hypothetical protein
MIAEGWRLGIAGEFDTAIEMVQTFSGTAAGAEAFGQGAAAITLTPLLAKVGRFDEAMACSAAWPSFIGNEAEAAYIPACAGLLDEARRETKRLIEERASRLKATSRRLQR